MTTISSSTEHNEKSKGSVLAIMLSLVSVLLLFSYLGWVISFIEIYEIYIGVHNSSELPDVKATAENIVNALIPYARCLVIALPGWICAMLVLLFTNYRLRICFWFWAASSIVLFLGFPFGTIFGVILGATLFIKRKQFANQA